MFARVRNLSVAGGSALALTILLSGVVAAATVLSAITVVNSDPTAPVVDTSKTFEDVDGNGIDDDCQTGDVVADPVAAASAEAAVDANGDGTISVSEAAQSDRTGGTNCNHGGYVSGVATTQCDTADAPEDSSTSGSDEDGAQQGDEEGAETGDAVETDETDETDATETTDEDCTDATTAEEDAPAECETTPTAPVDEPATVEPTAPEDLAPNAHGKAVAEVAQSDAVGGKNCNHGGAVSEAAKKDHEAAREAREAAKATREAAREARKAERESAHHGHKHGGD